MTTLETPVPTEPEAEPRVAQDSTSVDAVAAQRAKENRTAGIRLAVVAAGGLLLAQRVGALKTVLVVMAVFLMIMLHELGHYVMARRAGMKVTEFFVGFGPRVWSVRRGETEYGIKAFPLGGYVRVPGMTNLDEVPAADEARTYRQQGMWARVGMAAAGSTVHMIIAFLLLFALNVAVGNPQHVTVVPVVGSISKLTNGVSPAEDAGLLRNDRIVSIAGHPVVEFADLRAVVKSNPNVALPMVVDRKVNGTTQRLSLTITPADRGAAGGFLGIGPTAVKQTVNPIAATGRSITDFGSLFKSSVKAIVGIFSPHGFVGIADNVRGDTTTANAQGSRFLSPIGLVNVAGQTADQGLAYVFSLLVLLNIFVGLFNMLPLLPFDGGHVVLAIYEGIRSKIAGRRYYADAAKLLPVAYATVLFLLFIGVSSIWVDLRHPLKL